MKKAFVAILSLAALVSCSQDVTVQRNDSAAIGFDNTFVEAKTRAAADPSTTTASLEEFAVWGFRGTADELVLSNERVYKSGGEWTYDHLQYWMEGKDYFFGAVSPFNHKDVTVNTQTMSKGGLGTIDFVNTDGSVDLLYAEKTVFASEINPSAPEKVGLQFAHLLSRVKFSFEYDFTNELTTVAVKNIKINNSPAEGSIDVTVDRPNWSWNLPQNGNTVELAFGDVESGKEFEEENTYYESDNYRLLIPTDDTRNHNITFDVVVYQNHVESYTYNLATTLKDKAFVQGKSYNIVATITPDDLGLKPIEFKVIEVQGWEDGDVAAPIVLASPAVEATVAENVVTLTWDAIEGAAYYTVKVGDLTEKVEGTSYVFTGDYATEYEFSVVAVPAEGMNIEASEAAVVKATTDAEPIKYNLYLKNEDNWEAVYFYAWGDDFSTTDWPGVELTKTTVEEVEYYVYTLPSDVNGKTINFLFNNGGNGKQTADIEGVVVDKDYFYTNYVEPQEKDLVIYLQPNSNWNVDNARFAAYFFGAGETWESMTLVDGETNIYSVVVPGNYPNVIFCRMNPNATANNWNNKWNQTGDLKVPADDKVLFVVPANSWDGATATWTTYTVAEPEPVALATPEVVASVDVNVVTLTWEAVEGASHYTVQVDDDVEETVNATTYVFEGDYEVEYTFTVKAIAADTTKNTNSEAAVVTATTEAKPVVGPATLTVAEFLALTDVVPSDATAEEIAAAPRYTLTGTITSCTNTTYGNFYLNDGTGEVLIYGLVGPNGESQYWATSGAKVGDDITVQTIRTEYNKAPQGKNATFVEVKTPGTLAFWSFESSAVSFTAAGGEKTIKVDIYNAAAAVVATSDNAQFSATYANGVLTVSAEENTEFEPINGNITVTCGSLSQDITVSQAAASASGGEQTEVTAELKFIAANRTSFNTSQQVWEVEGVKLVNDKGSSTSNVADYVNPARFYKSSKITVTADGNISTIVFDCNSASYATALKDSIKTGTVSVSSDKVTVTLDGSSNEFVISSLTGGQVRMDSMTVTYLQ